MNKVTKLFEAQEVKALDERTLRFVASDERIDRDGERILAEGWVLSNYKKNPIVLLDHIPLTENIVGNSKVRVDGKRLVADITFAVEENPRAVVAHKLAAAGFLKTVSVGFLPVTWVDGKAPKEPRRTYTKQELLEISLVALPSNPGATRLDYEGAVQKGIITADEAALLTMPEAKGTEPPELSQISNVLKRVSDLEAEAAELRGQVGGLEAEMQQIKAAPAKPAGVGYLKALLSERRAAQVQDTQGDALSADDLTEAVKGLIADRAKEHGNQTD